MEPYTLPVTWLDPAGHQDRTLTAELSLSIDWADRSLVSWDIQALVEQLAPNYWTEVDPSTVPGLDEAIADALLERWPDLVAQIVDDGAWDLADLQVKTWQEDQRWD